MVQVYRSWINQPSSLQPLHALHGTKCLVIDDGKEGEGYVRIGFIDGPTITMRVPRMSLAHRTDIPILSESQNDRCMAISV